MVSVMIRLFDVEFWIMSANFNEFPIQVLPQLCSNDRMSEFGRKDYVVIAQVYAVIVPSVLMWLVHTTRVS